jgi:hypothetical protein
MNKEESQLNKLRMLLAMGEADRVDKMVRSMMGLY